MRFANMKLISCVRIVMSRLKRISTTQFEDIYFATRTNWSSQSNEMVDTTVIEGAVEYDTFIGDNIGNTSDRN